MIPTWTIPLLGLVYLAALFAVATWGDRLSTHQKRGRGRPLIYALSLGVYCTSWTYFGSVGIASRSGFDFLPIYLGPILVFALGWPLIQLIADIAKRQNIASIADFLSARYGKSEALGALATVIAVIGVVPYISIQLKAVSTSLKAILITPALPEPAIPWLQSVDGLSILVAVTMGGFAILFGTRHIDTTEHQDGMIFAISVESVVKLVAFVAIGLFVIFSLLGGLQGLAAHLSTTPALKGMFAGGLDGGRWFTLTVLAALAIILLPRQFHVAIVENASRDDIRRAAWLFPLYLIAINLFVIPIAAAGLVLLPPGSDGDTFVLALPVSSGSEAFTLIAFIGGLSASTAMVVVESIALSIMVCNNLVVPMLLRRRTERAELLHDMGRTLIVIRRLAIIVILLLAYAYYRMIGSTAALAQVGLISFAAVAQFGPAFFGAIIWRRATARGAMAAISTGAAVWAYTLMLPSFVDAGWLNRAIVDNGPLGIAFLRPRMLFNLEFDPLTHGVLWSLLANCTAFIAFSLSRVPTPIERLQAAGFVARDASGGAVSGFRLWRTSVTAEKLEQTVARYLGQARASSAFEEFFAQRGLAYRPTLEADIRLMRFAEHLLASAVGVASSRLVIALLLKRHTAQPRAAMRLLDDASAAIQYNRDLLQSAIENVGHGIAVFDGDLVLSIWNSKFRALLPEATAVARIGTPMVEVLAEFLRGTEGGRNQIDDCMLGLIERRGQFRQRMSNADQILELKSSAMPEGGTVVTFIDVTESVLAAEALQIANESLERRVVERTSELTRVNVDLAAAKAEAEAANIGKTKFIAAASHDILQPLNAARLFTSSLVERLQSSRESAIAKNVDSSLEAVEEILGALLDMSRLDAGAMKADIASFRIDELLEVLSQEFSPAARKQGLKLKKVTCGLVVQSDRKLLRRVLQNLLSNAIKYTAAGRVLVGCRRRGNSLHIEVHDTGPGIPLSQQRKIFEEFQRLEQDGRHTAGLGLGLSIVERIAKVLGSKITLASRPGRGSVFSLAVPITAAKIPKAAAQRPPRRPVGFGGTINVLIVDNETAIVEGMTLLLEGWGCKVQAAHSAGEAIASTKSDCQIDLIMADYHLGKESEDGIALVRNLRKKSRHHLPAILITADRSSTVCDMAIANDIHVLRKPVKPAALRAAMAHVVSKATAAG